MISDEVVVEAPPVDVHQQGMLGLGQGPGFAHQGSDGLAEGQVDAFDESGLDEAGEADGLVVSQLNAGNSKPHLFFRGL
jgi:hypothetical protein